MDQGPPTGNITIDPQFIVGAKMMVCVIFCRGIGKFKLVEMGVPLHGLAIGPSNESCGCAHSNNRISHSFAMTAVTHSNVTFRTNKK